MLTNVLISILSLVVIILFYLVYRLNIYISKLEQKIKVCIDVVENVKQSFKDTLMYDDFLLDSGKIKKTIMQSEKANIVNGLNLEERNLEI